MTQHQRGVNDVEKLAGEDAMMQHEPAAAGEIDVDHLNIWRMTTDFIFAGEVAPQIVIAALVVDCTLL